MNYGHQNLSPVSVLETHLSIPVDHVCSTGGVFVEKPMVKIPLTKGMFALVDDEDVEKISHLSWHVSKRKCNCYATANPSGSKSKTYMHRLVSMCPKGMVVDHINGNGLDNRKSNLRVVNYQKNLLHTNFVKGISKYRGVSIHRKTNQWACSICDNGKKYWLGYFKSQKMAALAYDKMARFLWGDWAPVNFK